MTHAELLRKHATDATNEGGMWFSGEYMTMLASMAESIEAENAKLREACAELLEMAESNDPDWLHWPEMYEELRKLGVGVAK